MLRIARPRLHGPALAVSAGCALFAVIGCASAPVPAEAQKPTNPAANPADTLASADNGRPLAPFAARPLAFLPAQYLNAADSLGFIAQVGDPAVYLAQLDEEIAFALAARKAGKKWQGPAILARRMKANGPYGVDVYDVSSAPLRNPRLNVALPLPEPLASNLRSLVALGTESRYVLIPYEVLFMGAKGAGRAVLKLALVDARGASLVWLGAVASDPVPKFSPALVASLAEHVADLVAAP
jgi:transposase InsO family protein